MFEGAVHLEGDADDFFGFLLDPGADSVGLLGKLKSENKLVLPKLLTAT